MIQATEVVAIDEEWGSMLSIHSKNMIPVLDRRYPEFTPQAPFLLVTNLPPWGGLRKKSFACVN
jgi:hypothetical protein